MNENAEKLYNLTRTNGINWWSIWLMIKNLPYRLLFDFKSILNALDKLMGRHGSFLNIDQNVATTRWDNGMTVLARRKIGNKINRAMCFFNLTKRSKGFPSLKMMNVGNALTWYRSAMLVYFSVSILTTWILSFIFSLTSSRTETMNWQGPHLQQKCYMHLRHHYKI